MNDVRQLGRAELLDWANRFAEASYPTVEALRDGVVFLQLLDAVFPGKVPLHKVTFNCTEEKHRARNWALLDALFGRCGLEKRLDVPRLVQGNFVATYELLQWAVALVRVRRPGLVDLLVDGEEGAELPRADHADAYRALHRRTEAARTRRGAAREMPPHLLPAERPAPEFAESFRELPQLGDGSSGSSSDGVDDDAAGGAAALPPLARQGSLPSSSAMMHGAATADDLPARGGSPALYDRARELEDLIASLETDVRARLASHRDRLDYVAHLGQSRELYFDMLLHIEGACETFPPSETRDRVREALYEEGRPLFHADDA